MRQTGIDVDLIFSGRQGSYIDMDEFGEFGDYKGLTFCTENGRVNLPKTVANLAPWRFYSDCRSLDLSKYDLVLNDFEPVTAWAARLKGVPSVSISHQAAFRQSIPTKGTNFGTRQLMRHFAPTDQGIGVHWYHFNQDILPPLVDECHPSPGEKNVVLVYLPFENLDDVINLLQRFTRVRFICFHPAAKNEFRGNVELRSLCREGFLEALHRCSGVFCNSGFELPSEAMAAGKKLLVKPLQGQFEQLSNALTLQLLGLGCVMSELNPAELDAWLDLDNPEPLYFPNVASALAQWLVNGRKESIDELKVQLWSQVSFPTDTLEQIADLHS
jgi:uncharacterized protein (TIGR00661 family)